MLRMYPRLICKGFWNVRLCKDSLGWPATEGVIVIILIISIIIRIIIIIPELGLPRRVQIQRLKAG